MRVGGVALRVRDPSRPPLCHLNTRSCHGVVCSPLLHLDGALLVGIWSRHHVLSAHDAALHDGGGNRSVDGVSDQVWLHGGLDIISVSVLLLALSKVPATKATLQLAAIVGMMPTAAILYTLVTTPYWTPLILVPGLGCFAFAVWGFLLSTRMP